MNGLAGALCVGQHELFESTDLADHIEAATICERCPALEACGAELRRVAALAATITEQGGGPVGTWAGHLINHRGRATPFRARCGTDSGYGRHRRAGEQPCADCVAAHTAAVRRVG